MNNELATKLFQAVIDVLNRNQVFYWLDYGTLLGAIREGDFIEDDMDIDISFLSCGEDTFRELARLGLKFEFDYVGDYLRKTNILVNSFKGYAKLELVPKHTKGKYMYKLIKEENGDIYGAKEPAIENTMTYYFKDRFCNIPAEPEKYLEFHYGDWKTKRQDISKTYKKFEVYESIHGGGI